MEREARGAEGTRPAGPSSHTPADDCHLRCQDDGAWRLPGDPLRPETAQGNARRLDLLGQGAGSRQPAGSIGAAPYPSDRALRQVDTPGFVDVDPLSVVQE